MNIINVGIIGSSGYTGADLIRILYNHKNVNIKFLAGNSKSGMCVGDVFSSLAHFDLPNIISVDDILYDDIDVVFLALPHGLSHNIVPDIIKKKPNIKLIDLSSDYRFNDINLYLEAYSIDNVDSNINDKFVYGLTELYKNEIINSNYIACPGCYPTATLLGILPLVEKQYINCENIIIDAKSGITGAGRKSDEKFSFCELNEGVSAYSVGVHRHAPEIEEKISLFSSINNIKVTFTPHLVPMNRGELVTIYLERKNDVSNEMLIKLLEQAYESSKFVNVCGDILNTHSVRGSNFCNISVKQDRVENRSIIVSTIDNLVKGSSGQAVQCMNLMFGFDESEGLLSLPLFP